MDAPKKPQSLHKGRLIFLGILILIFLFAIIFVLPSLRNARARSLAAKQKYEMQMKQIQAEEDAIK